MSCSAPVTALVHERDSRLSTQPLPRLFARLEYPQVVRKDLRETGTERDGTRRANDGQPDAKAPQLVEDLTCLAGAQVEETWSEILWIEKGLSNARGQAGFNDQRRVLWATHQRFSPRPFDDADTELVDHSKRHAKRHDAIVSLREAAGLAHAHTRFRSIQSLSDKSQNFRCRLPVWSTSKRGGGLF